jgi:hypothetical protein
LVADSSLACRVTCLAACSMAWADPVMAGQRSSPRSASRSMERRSTRCRATSRMTSSRPASRRSTA